MSDDWNFGDKAKYDDSLAWCGCCHLEGDDWPRELYTVNAITPYVGEPVGLSFVEEPPPYGGSYCSCRWRKVRPDERSGDADDWELILDSVKRRVDA